MWMQSKTEKSEQFRQRRRKRADVDALILLASLDSISVLTNSAGAMFNDVVNEENGAFPLRTKDSVDLGNCFGCCLPTAKAVAVEALRATATAQARYGTEIFISLLSTAAKDNVNKRKTVVSIHLLSTTKSMMFGIWRHSADVFVVRTRNESRAFCAGFLCLSIITA